MLAGSTLCRVSVLLSLLVNDLQIFYRVYPVFYMRDLRVFKASADMENAIHCLYVR